MLETNRIINGDCVEVMETLPKSSIDLIVTSCPYGVGIAYDVHDDDVHGVHIHVARVHPGDRPLRVVAGAAADPAHEGDSPGRTPAR